MGQRNLWDEDTEDNEDSFREANTRKCGDPEGQTTPHTEL